MIQFAEQFSDKQIVVTLSRQLSWSHFFSNITPRSHDFAFFLKFLKTINTIKPGCRLNSPIFNLVHHS
jgi:hypothetical protein